jgi:hypothetical protein
LVIIWGDVWRVFMHDGRDFVHIPHSNPHLVWVAWYRVKELILDGSTRNQTTYFIRRNNYLPPSVLIGL